MDISISPTDFLQYLQPKDTTKRERQKLTVIKKDGDRCDTVVIEADEMMVNFGNRATTLFCCNITTPDAVFCHTMKTIPSETDRYRFYVPTHYRQQLE